MFGIIMARYVHVHVVTNVNISCSCWACNISPSCTVVFCQMPVWLYKREELITFRVWHI